MYACSMYDSPPVEVDGSVLEGGGQILRTAVSLSALTGIAVRVFNIRAGRSKPGLAAQHLKGIEIVRAMCQGQLLGGTIGSTEIKFKPGQIKGGAYFADIQTAGAISLIMQIATPCALFADGLVSLDLRGGTNAEMAPQVDFTTEVFRPNLERFGASFNFELLKRGYFPVGGGHALVDIEPLQSLCPVTLIDRGNMENFCGWSYVAGSLSIKLADTMTEAAKQVLSKYRRPINIESYKETPKMAPNNASGIILVCQTTSKCIIGGAGLGGRNNPPFQVGSQAAQSIVDVYERGACVDDHIQDQLILYMALANGKSSIRVGELTEHTKTVIHVIELFTQVRFNVIRDGQSNIIECQGMGLKNPVFDQPLQR